MSASPYADYRTVASVNWPEKVPAHWDIKKLSHMALLKSGESITSEEIDALGPYPVYGGNGTRGYCDRYTHDGEFVLIGRQGALCGNINYAKGKFWASEHAVVVRPLQWFATRWMGELLRAMNLNQYSVSAAQPGLSVATVGALRIPVPPVDEQRAIADFLERETTRIDALLHLKQRLRALLTEKKKRQVDDLLLPNGQTPLTRLKYVVESVGGLQIGPFGSMLIELSGEETGYKLYGQQNTISGDFEAGRRWITDSQYAALRANYGLAKGDVVVTRKASLGHCREVPPEVCPGIIDSDTIRFRFDKAKVHVPYVVRLLRAATYVAEQIGRSARGAILSNLNTSTIGGLLVWIPDVRTQRRIEAECAEIEQQVAEADRMLANSVTRYEEYRSCLISAAVTGQIDVRTYHPQEAAVSCQ